MFFDLKLSPGKSGSLGQAISRKSLASWPGGIISVYMQVEEDKRNLQGSAYLLGGSGIELVS